MKQFQLLTASPVSRRDFVRGGIQTAAVAAIGSAIPLRAARAGTVLAPHARVTGAATLGTLADPDLMRTLVLRAIDAARSAGARYADARVSRYVSEASMEPENPMLRYDQEYIEIGVRALVDGAWGFSASTYWDEDEPTILAKDAVAQARINASIFPRQIELGKYPVATGSWVTPIQIDPFQISLEEKLDFVGSLGGLLPRHRNARTFRQELYWTFTRIEQAVATTEGSCFSQILYRGGGLFRIDVGTMGLGAKDDVTWVESPSDMVGAGWECIIDAKFREQIPEMLEEAEANLFLPVKPVDPGRYDIVMPAKITAQLIARTIGDATQLDRALGYEANAGGTSYLGPDPLTHLGTQLGSPLLNVQGNRSQPRGLATVKWDDEGVEPDTFSLVRDGKLVDYQTTREQSAWLAPWYQSQQRPERSHGCAVAPTAKYFPMQHTPNLQMQPGKSAISFADMIATTKRGVAFMARDGRISTDFQSRTGTGGGILREIVNGRLGAVLQGAMLSFDSRQLWKNLSVIGGAPNAEMISNKGSKGQPTRESPFSVTAVPALFKDLAVIDRNQK